MISNRKRLNLCYQNPKPTVLDRPTADNREVLEGILWNLRNGARWKGSPKQYFSAFHVLAQIKRLRIRKVIAEGAVKMFRRP
jgi:transposase